MDKRELPDLIINGVSGGQEVLITACKSMV